MPRHSYRHHNCIKLLFSHEIESKNTGSKQNNFSCFDIDMYVDDLHIDISC